jgi:hypothetical protein
MHESQHVLTTLQGWAPDVLPEVLKGVMYKEANGAFEDRSGFIIPHSAENMNPR